MCKKNLEKNGIYWKIRNHVVLHCEDFDEKNNIPFTVYNKKHFKEKRISKEGRKYSIDGFKKVQLIKGICNFDTIQSFNNSSAQQLNNYKDAHSNLPNQRKRGHHHQRSLDAPAAKQIP